MKFLIAGALIGAMSQTAMAQIQEQCKYLQNVTDFEFKPDKAGHFSLFALVHNEGPSDVIFAAFSFDFLADEHFKIGEGTTNIGRLIHGDTEPVQVSYPLGLNISDIHL